MQPNDPFFPNLPFVSDEEYATWTKEQQDKRHALEVAEAAKLFDALQAGGMDIFEAAERVPTPRANRAGVKQSELRKLYAGTHNAAPGVPFKPRNENDEPPPGPPPAAT